MPEPKTADSQATESIGSMAEGKLSRVEMIAREALEILGEAAPEDLRRSAAEERARHEAAMRRVENDLRAATQQAGELERQLKSAERLAADRLQEAEEVWDLAQQQAADLAEKAGTLDTVRDDLALARITADSRAREVDELSSELHAASSRADEAEADLVSVGRALDEAAAARDTLRDSLDEALTRVDALAAELAEAQDAATVRTARLEAVIAAAERELLAQNERAMTAESDLAEAQTALESQRSDLERTREDLAVRAATLTDTEERLQNARERVASLETRVETLSSTYQQLIAERDDALESLGRAEREIASLRHEIAQFSAKLADRDKTIAGLSVAGSATAELSAAADDAGTPTIDPGWERELASLREQLDRADERASRYRARAHDAERRQKKAVTMVRRARRRAAIRTEAYAGTINAMSQMRAGQIELERALERTTDLAKTRLTWLIATSSLAVLAFLSAAV
ncbi:MAG: hypothetical protein AAGF47_01720 [Planctomycetota bacterium]